MLEHTALQSISPICSKTDKLQNVVIYTAILRPALSIIQLVWGPHCITKEDEPFFLNCLGVTLGLVGEDAAKRGVSRDGVLLTYL